MRPPSTRQLKDTVRIHAPASTAGRQLSPNANTPGAAGDPMACSVQEVSRGTSYQAGDVPYGSTLYELVFAADPGVAKSDQTIVWFERKGVALASPITMTSAGPVRPPSGLRERWTVSAIQAG